jgi:hypothetical protein
MHACNRFVHIIDLLVVIARDATLKSRGYHQSALKGFWSKRFSPWLIYETGREIVQPVRLLSLIDDTERSLIDGYTRLYAQILKSPILLF